LEISINEISDDTIVNYLIEECGADIKKKKKKKKKNYIKKKIWEKIKKKKKKKKDKSGYCL